MSDPNGTSAQITSIEPLLPPGSNPGKVENFEIEEPRVKHGLGVITAGLFLAGEMAGSGVLALPAAMVGTGKYTNFLKSIKYYKYCLKMMLKRISNNF
jgi:hypothetical protein